MREGRRVARSAMSQLPAAVDVPTGVKCVSYIYIYETDHTYLIDYEIQYTMYSYVELYRSKCRFPMYR